MSRESDLLQKKIDVLEQEISALKKNSIRHGVRIRSTKYLCSMPLYDIAIGPDFEKNERRGHARGIFAIGDIATGVFALGGIARGLFAIGGVALGAVSLGGCSIGLIIGIGGLAVGMLAIGGAAVGVIAVGGGAFGYYACGGGAFGKYVISASGQDPEAVRFFGQWIPGINQLIRPPGR